ncbi:MAG: VOC family protein [Gemmatimonadota bacterium]
MSTKASIPVGAPQRAVPESLRARSLRAALTVRDLEKSLAWYRDVAGFTVEQKHEYEGKVRAVSLKAGDVQILIGQDDGKKGWDRVKGEGLSLQLTTAQDIDTVANEMKARGAKLETEPADMPWGPRLFRLRDPDGFILVISSLPPGES